MEGGQTWSEERVERLRSLWDDGLSASRIAVELGGMTRNMVMGKAHRLGLSRIGSQPQPARERHVRSQPAIVRVVDLAPPEAVAPPPAFLAIVRPPRPEPSDGAGDGSAVTIMELAPSMCRWPLGDPSTDAFRYCGASIVPGQPYCGCHCGLAYEPERRRASRG